VFASLADYDRHLDQALAWCLGLFVGPLPPHVLGMAEHLLKQKPTRGHVAH